MYTVAQNVISKFPNIQMIADICGVDVSTVHKWKYPKERGGTGGIVPAQYQQMLVDAAPEHDVDLKPDDFFIASKTPSPKSLTNRACNSENSYVNEN